MEKNELVKWEDRIKTNAAKIKGAMIQANWKALINRNSTKGAAFKVIINDSGKVRVEHCCAENEFWDALCQGKEVEVICFDYTSTFPIYGTPHLPIRPEYTPDKELKENAKYGAPHAQHLFKQNIDKFFNDNFEFFLKRVAIDWANEECEYEEMRREDYERICREVEESIEE